MNTLRQRESGQVLVLFALAVVAIVALLAVVVDGGFLYVQRRTAQTAADAGALAGARALREVSTLAAIGQAATNAAQANAFGTTPTIQCIYLVDPNGAWLGTLPGGFGSAPSCPTGWASGINGASGVHVDVQISYQTIMAGMLRISRFDADGHATAQLARPGALNTLDAPLIVCGGGPTGAAARVSSSPPITMSGTQILNDAPPLPTYTVNNNSGYVMEQFLNSSGTLDETMNGHVYYLKGPVIGQASDSTNILWNDCGAHSNTFDGGAEPDQAITGYPAQLLGTKGNSVPAIGTQVEAPGGCAGGVVISSWTAGSQGCIMRLPVASGSINPGSNAPLLVISTEAAFYVWCNKSSNSGTGCQEYVGQLIVNEDVVGNMLANVAMTGGTRPTGMIAVHLTQ
jgi:hypothetical protein